MSKFRFALLLLVSPLVLAQQPHASEPDHTKALERDFKSASSAYDQGNYADAANLLEKLQSEVPKSFEVHELLGLTYAAQAKDTKAVEQLEIAVHLQAKAVVAINNLAAGLMRLGKQDQARAEYQEAVTLNPKDYSANHNLAAIYLQTQDLARAIPLLEAAQRVRPNAYDNGYDLALAYLLSDRLSESRLLVSSLLQQKDSGELHNLLGRIDEKEGAYVAAATEFQTAARMDPSEDNLFVLASELLLHHTYDPAIEVFTAATKRYPSSPRLFTGLGMALYSHGEYERSVTSLLTAADLNPHDPRCYLFLSKAYLSSPNQAEDVIARFRRYADLEPANAMSQYYLALGLWKGRRLESNEAEYQTIEALLRRSISLDGNFTEAHLQLGNLYSDQHEYSKALPEYQRALQLSPNLPDAHFRMGRYYQHAGEKQKAQSEFDAFNRLKMARQAEEDKAKVEVQQFIVAAQAMPQKPDSSAVPVAHP